MKVLFNQLNYEWNYEGLSSSSHNPTGYTFLRTSPLLYLMAHSKAPPPPRHRSGPQGCTGTAGSSPTLLCLHPLHTKLSSTPASSSWRIWHASTPPVTPTSTSHGSGVLQVLFNGFSKVICYRFLMLANILYLCIALLPMFVPLFMDRARSLNQS